MLKFVCNHFHANICYCMSYHFLKFGISLHSSIITQTSQQPKSLIALVSILSQQPIMTYIH